MRTTGNGNHTDKCATLPGADAVQIEPLIVIAEEQPAIRKLLRWMLHLVGYRAMVCVDRQAALTWRAQAMTPGNVPVVLLLDLSPFCATEVADFLHRVRRRWQEARGVLPQIIVLTTHLKVQAGLGPRERVLPKPFHARDLLALIQQIISFTT